MNKNKQTKDTPEGMRSLPKPIQLDLPKERTKPRKRLHEPDPESFHDASHEYMHIPEPEMRHKEVKHERETRGKRYFDSAQKAYGQHRPRERKPSKPKQNPKQQATITPRLGKGDRLYTPPTAKKPLVPPKVKRVLRFWALGLIAIAFIILGLINIFGHNAWAVYLDGDFIGYMPINREVEPESVHESAVNHLSGFLLGATVQVNEQATVRPTRARASNIDEAPDMIRRISQQFTYQIAASAIYLDGERIAILRSASDAEHVANEIKRQFTTGSTLTDLTAFEEDWQIRTVMVEQDAEMDSPNDVRQWLERPVNDVIRHVIRQNDTQGALAIEFNTTVERIGYLNDITRYCILGTGNILLIEITRPRLTVRTIDQETRTELIPYETETVQNPDLIRDGRAGEQEIVQRTTKLNGVQVGAPEIVSTRTIREPEARITVETIADVR